MSNPGAHACVRITPTGRPAWTGGVSAPSRAGSVRAIASKLAHAGGAPPGPPHPAGPSGTRAPRLTAADSQRGLETASLGRILELDAELEGARKLLLEQSPEQLAELYASLTN